MGQSLMPGHTNNLQASKTKPKLFSVSLGTCGLCTFFAETSGGSVEIQL